MRHWHRKLAWLVVLPAGFIVMTGMALQLRRVVPWIQPSAQVSSFVGVPKIELQAAFSNILASEKVGNEAEVSSWDDVKSVDYKPSQGTWSFKTKSFYEIQVDGHTGAILSSAPRRSLWLMQLHEGSFFGELVLWLVFFPTGVVLFILELTGLYLLVGARMKKRRIHG